MKDVEDMHKKNTSCDVGYVHNIKWGNIHKEKSVENNAKSYERKEKPSLITKKLALWT